MNASCFLPTTATKSNRFQSSLQNYKLEPIEQYHQTPGNKMSMHIQTTTDNMSSAALDYKEIQSQSHHKRAVTMANKETIRAPAIVSIRSELTKSRFAPVPLPKDKKEDQANGTAAKKVIIEDSLSPPPRRVSRT